MAGKKIGKKREGEATTGSCSVARAILIAALLTIIGYVIHTVEAILTMNYYIDPAYFGVWSRVMMPAAGPPPMEFTYLSLAFGFAVALIYIWAYKVVQPALEGADGWVKRGLLFGALLFLLGVVPGSLSLYLLINLPAAIIGWWALSGLLIAFVDGVLIAKFC
ncbi:hypothetical protein H0O02_05020 [Candidatus Micrarchaeota archaeon]|nr:hypothetical protein [Candidatus Micrarchaeota archaeon]